MWPQNDEALDPRLREALDDPRRLRQLASKPRGERVVVVPVLHEAAALEISTLVRASSGDDRRAGAAGGGGVSPDGERQRVVLSDGSAGDAAKAWCEWFVRRVLEPLCAAHFAATSTTELHAHAYALRYRRLGAAGTEDPTALRFHTDDADLTFNLNLGDAWTGGDLLFVDDDPDRAPGTPKFDDERRKGTLWRCPHRIGVAVLHDSCYHAAEPLDSGERIQLVFWLLRDDEPWKRDYFARLERNLASF